MKFKIKLYKGFVFLGWGCEKILYSVFIFSLLWVFGWLEWYLVINVW